MKTKTRCTNFAITKTNAKIYYKYANGYLNFFFFFYQVARLWLPSRTLSIWWPFSSLLKIVIVGNWFFSFLANNWRTWPIVYNIARYKQSIEKKNCQRQQEEGNKPKMNSTMLVNGPAKQTIFILGWELDKYLKTQTTYLRPYCILMHQPDTFFCQHLSTSEHRT